MTFYYALTDENRVLCVDRLDPDSKAWDEDLVGSLADSYPDTIYFKIDNRVPEFRVPIEEGS